MIIPNLKIKQEFRNELIEKIALKDINSLNSNRLEDIIEKYQNNELCITINPQVRNSDVENYLSKNKLLILRFLGLLKYLIFILTTTISIVYSDYEYLVAIPIIIFFSVAPRPYNIRFIHFLNFILIAVFLIWGIKIHIIGYLCSLIFILRLIKLLETRLIEKTLKNYVLQDEKYFIRLYLRNILLLSNKNMLFNSKEESDLIIDSLKNNNPIELNHYERLYFCKRCTNKSYDLKNGIFCLITNKKPDFIYQCNKFNLNKDQEKKIKNEYFNKNKRFKEAIESKNTGSIILYIIAGLIIFTNSYFYFHSTFPKAISSGILEFVYIKFNFYNYFLGIVLSIIFLSFGLLLRNNHSIGLYFGIGLYGIDTLLSLYYLNFDIWIHFIFLIFLGYNIYQFWIIKKFNEKVLRIEN